MSDIASMKAPRDQRPDSCLHCVLMTQIEEWHERHGDKRDGQVVIDVTLVVQKLVECVVEFTEATGERSQRRRAFRFAHDCLDAQLKSARTGKLVELDIPAEH